MLIYFSVNVYNATAYFKNLEYNEEDDIHPLNLCVLEDCPLWVGEIPENSFVAVNFVPNVYFKEGEDRLTFRLISAAILLLPSM